MTNSKIQFKRDLKVWLEAVNLAERCYYLTKTFPKEDVKANITLAIGDSSELL